MDFRGTATVSGEWLEGCVAGEYHLAGGDGGNCCGSVGDGGATDLMTIYFVHAWSLRELLVTFTVLAIATFWILRRRSLRDLFALVLAALTLVIITETAFFILNPGKNDSKRFLIYEGFGWLAALICWSFNRILRTPPESEGKTKGSPAP